MKINFSAIPVRAGLSSKKIQIVDMREAFADLTYGHGQGIACKALALKVYNSQADTDYNEQEVLLIQSVAEQLCTPAVYDGIMLIMEAQRKADATENKEEKA